MFRGWLGLDCALAVAFGVALACASFFGCSDETGILDAGAPRDAEGDSSPEAGGPCATEPAPADCDQSCGPSNPCSAGFHCRFGWCRAECHAGEDDECGSGMQCDAHGMCVPRMDAGTDAMMDADIDGGGDAGTDADIDGGNDAGDAGDRFGCPTDIPALAGDPVIDGTLETGLELISIEPRGWSGAEPLPDDISVSYALGWRPSGLYVYVQVRTDARHAPPEDLPYCGDAIELFIDADGSYDDPPLYDAMGTMQFIIAAPDGDAVDPRRHAHLYRNMTFVRDWGSDLYDAFPTPDGYVVEAFVRGEDLDLPGWALEAAADIGFNLSVDVGREHEGEETFACESRLGQFSIHVAEEAIDGCDKPFCSTDAFCTVGLK